MQFRLTITMGNDAMQTGEDVAFALERVAEDVRLRLGDGAVGRIMDDNGNSVGAWSAFSKPLGDES